VKCAAITTRDISAGSLRNIQEKALWNIKMRERSSRSVNKFSRYI